ncbi:MAG: CynX/NimT family MFS transporter [Candidatus Bathyarchaeia archaeon]
MLTLAFLTAFTLHLLLFSYAPLVSWIMSEMGLSHAQGGFIFSVCILTLIILRIPWGLLSDYLGLVTTTKIATAFIGVFGLLRGFAVNYETLLISQLLLGVGFAAVLPCLSKLVNMWFKEKAGLTTGVYAAGFPIGDMVALSLTPFILALLFYSWRNVFYIYGIVGLILTALWWTAAREPIRKKDQGLTHRMSLGASLKREVASVVRVKEVWILTGLCIASMGCYDTIVWWLPSMLESRGVPFEVAGLMTSMLPLGFLVASLSIGALSDFVGLRKPFICILGLVSGPSILAITTFSDSPLWIAIFLAGFSTTGILTLVLAIPTELPELTQLVASAVGLVSSLGNIGPFLLPIATGYIKDITGYFSLAMIMLAVVAETTLILGLAMRETGRKLARQNFSNQR